MTYDTALKQIQSKLGYSLERAKDFLFYLYDHFKKVDLDVVHDRIIESKFKLRYWAFRYRFHLFYYPFYEDSWFDSLNCWLYRNVTRRFKDWAFDRKMTKQRAMRCFSERDTWYLDNWITETLANAIDYFADTCQTLPPQAEAWMKGLDPDTYKKNIEDDSEEQTKEEAEWWKAYLKKLAFTLREANPNTCTLQNEHKLIAKWHFEPNPDVPGSFKFVSDCTDEEQAQNIQHWERELELRKYYRAQFANAMKMLAMVYGELND